MTFKLPSWYPLANATDDEIDAWLIADQPPYDEMKRALPWLDHEYQFDAWIEGVKEGRAVPADAGWLAKYFSGLVGIPMPPKRLEGRHQ